MTKPITEIIDALPDDAYLSTFADHLCVGDGYSVHAADLKALFKKLTAENERLTAQLAETNAKLAAAVEAIVYAQAGFDTLTACPTGKDRCVQCKVVAVDNFNLLKTALTQLQEQK